MNDGGHVCLDWYNEMEGEQVDRDTPTVLMLQVPTQPGCSYMCNLIPTSILHAPRPARVLYRGEVWNQLWGSFVVCVLY